MEFHLEHLFSRSESIALGSHFLELGREAPFAVARVQACFLKPPYARPKLDPFRL
jgi:hypothetical protein